MLYGVIYRVTCIETGKCYIGRTKNSLKGRWQQHCRPDSNCLYVKRAIAKYGKESFTIEAIASSWDAESLKELEALLIQQENTLAPHGYNLRKDTREGVSEVSEEVRAKMRGHTAWNKGIPCSEDTKRKLSASLKGRAPNSGSFQDGDPAPITAFQKGHSTWNKGKTGPATVLGGWPKGVPKGAPWNKGISHSEEHKQNLCIARRKRAERERAARAA